MNYERTIPASEWREEETWRRGALHARDYKSAGYLATLAAADFCAREAEKAEAREKCERGDHDWFFGYDFVAAPPSGAAALCKRCNRCGWAKPESSDREKLREDVRALIRAYADDGGTQYARVRAAELRDFYRRQFPGEDV